MSNYINKELKRIDEEKEFWSKYAQLFEAEIHAWSFKNSAQLRRKDGSIFCIGGYATIGTNDIDNLVEKCQQIDK